MHVYGIADCSVDCDSASLSLGAGAIGIGLDSGVDDVVSDMVKVIPVMCCFGVDSHMVKQQTGALRRLLFSQRNKQRPVRLIVAGPLLYILSHH